MSLRQNILSATRVTLTKGRASKKDDEELEDK
jgi:hypothetical protein